MTEEDLTDDTWRERAAELLRLGLAELENERYESAAQMLLDSLTVYEGHRDDEGSLSVATYLGFALYEQGQQDRAVSVWEEILRRGSSLPTVYTLLAKHYKGLGEDEEVQRILETLRTTIAADVGPVPGTDGDQASPDVGALDPAWARAPSDEGHPRILVADDEEGIREVLRRFLSERGYAVEVAEDGEEALLAVLHRHPALVLMDVYMPKRSGLDVLMKMRAEGFDTPVIVISGYANASFVRDGLALGAEFLSKPIDLADLEDAVNRVLSGTRPDDFPENAPEEAPEKAPGDPDQG